MIKTLLLLLLGAAMLWAYQHPARVTCEFNHILAMAQKAANGR